MTFIFPVEPYPDESLAGLIVRATASNFYRSPLVALRSVDVVTTAPGSLSGRSPADARSIAKLVGSRNIAAIEKMYHPPIEGRQGWINFFGEPLRAFYRDAERRRVSPRALRKGDYVRAMWSLRPLSFDPLTKEQLIDSCPQCRRGLGWTRTYGVAFCDHCSRPERFMHFTWHYPGLDLRDFPQPLVEVNDEEALDFVTALIDPAPGRKEASRRMLPEMWSGLPNGEIFEVVMTFASMLTADWWDNNKMLHRRMTKSGEGWSRITPQILSVAGRAILGGQAGFEEFGDMLRSDGESKPRSKRYGKRSEIGPLGIPDPILCADAREILGRATDAYLASRRDPVMMPLAHLSRKYGVSRPPLTALADSGLIPTVKFDGLKKAPVLMSDAALAPLIRQMRNAVSGAMAAPKIGVHRMHLEELERRGLLERVEGPVLKLLEAESYYTLGSVENLNAKLAKSVARRLAPGSVRLKIALRILKVGHVPWTAILTAIVEGRLKTFSLKPKGSLGDRLAIVDLKALAGVIEHEAASSPPPTPEWVGNAAAAEILGTNESVVWRLWRVGKLLKHEESPIYAPFKRSEVERLARDVIFVPEIARIGKFPTYRGAARWLSQQDIDAPLELKQGGWKLYRRAPVERALRQLVVPPKTSINRKRPCPGALLHGRESSEEKLASVRESHDSSRIGFATAASLLGTTVFAVRMLAAIGKLEQKGGVTPFSRVQVGNLAKTIIFIPEVKQRFGLRSHKAALRMLKRGGITPLLHVAGGPRLPVFERAPVEKLSGQPIAIGNAHPRERKDKLLALVATGSSVRAASELLEIPYGTAGQWVRVSRSSQTTT